jgi:hypothetical protein
LGPKHIRCERQWRYERPLFESCRRSELHQYGHHRRFLSALRYQITARLWVAGGIQYDTGLPFQPNCNYPPIEPCIAEETAIYGPEVTDRLNWVRFCILPSFQVNASVGAEVYKSDRVSVQFQADGQNLTNIVDVIDFGGLFSGNAIGPSRSFALRLTTSF